jgi:hypothetical protein
MSPGIVEGGADVEPSILPTARTARLACRANGPGVQLRGPRSASSHGSPRARDFYISITTSRARVAPPCSVFACGHLQLQTLVELNRADAVAAERRGEEGIE